MLSDEERRRHGLNRCSLRPCAASPRVITVDEIDEVALAALADNVPRWLLYPTRERRGGPLERYLLQADALDVHDRHLVTQRVRAGRPWWRVEADFDAPTLFSYFNRARARVVRNRIGAVPLNNWLVIQPRAGIETDALFAALLETLRSGRIANEARRYGKGLWKLEPSELKLLRLAGDVNQLAGPSRG